MPLPGMLPGLERTLQTLYTVNTRNDRREEDSQAVLREQTLSSSDLTPALSGVGQDSAARHNVNTVDEDILRQCSLDSKSFGAAGWPNTLSHRSLVDESSTRPENRGFHAEERLVEVNDLKHSEAAMRVTG